MSSFDLCTRIVQGLRPRRPELPRYADERSEGAVMSDTIWAFVQKCWDRKPSNRPSAEEAAQFFRRMAQSG